VGPNGAGRPRRSMHARPGAPDAARRAFPIRRSLPRADRSPTFRTQLLYEDERREHIEMQRRAYSKFDADRAANSSKASAFRPARKTGKISKGCARRLRRPRLFALPECWCSTSRQRLDPVTANVLNLIVNEAASETPSCSRRTRSARGARRRTHRDHERRSPRGRGMVDDLKADRKIVEGIMPTTARPSRAERKPARPPRRAPPHLARVRSGDAAAIAKPFAGGAAGCAS